MKLVVDHKTPVAWGGTDDIENLELLCVEHNHAKQALFSSLNPYSDAIRSAISHKEPQMRVGELLKALEGQEVPVDLVNLVAREENRGDPTKRMRELRALGWRFRSGRRKQGKRTLSFYVLEHWEAWPPEGPRAAINRLEAERKRRKKQK